MYPRYLRHFLNHLIETQRFPQQQQRSTKECGDAGIAPLTRIAPAETACIPPARVRVVAGIEHPTCNYLT